MRIVTPLFGFGYDGDKEFTFATRPYHIGKFEPADRDIANDIELFSRQDVEWMRDAWWALIAEIDDPGTYTQDMNLLLVGFRIYMRSFGVFVKYHLCKENARLSCRLNDVVKEIPPQEETAPLNVTEKDLAEIDTGFTKLLEMERISDRTHNALYFLYRGLCAQKMIDGFVYLMMAVESLFSKDKRGPATKTVCSRASAFLDSRKNCTYADVESLYDLRSKIVHGRVRTSNDIKGKQQVLWRLQYVVCECMKKLLDNDLYQMYADDSQKESYFQRLASGKGA